MTGTIDSTAKSNGKRPWRRCTAAEIAAVRDGVAAGLDYAAIARRLGVSPFRTQHIGYTVLGLRRLRGGLPSASPWRRIGDEEIKDLLETGLSTARIAARLSDIYGVRITKNMVIGRIDRRGLRDHAPPPRPGALIAAIPAAGCRWIVGAPLPLRPDMYCGKPCAPGSSYCAAHHAIVWRAPDALPQRPARAA